MSLFFIGDLNILKDKRVSDSDYRVYCCLTSYMNKESGICYPRHATISKAIGKSRTSIYRSILHLAKLGYVTVKRRSSTNEYFLSQQLKLQETRKKNIMFHQRSSDVANSTDINKTNNINYNKFKKYNSYQRARYSPPVANHSKSTIEYQGEQYEYCAEFGDSIEYRNKNGDKIAKHKWKKDEPIKKFDAIEKVAR
tara:strand:+ start:150 stop:737 length:588 start_codon:yes stop_codon:yes gene_type:complete